MRIAFLWGLLVAACLAPPGIAADANRLTYLDAADPYYASLELPALTTPQWVGEPGVEAVVVLAIDDMRGHEKWEAYLRPILERLKKIDGRALGQHHDQPGVARTNRICSAGWRRG